ncbi:hypothetical protein ABZU22_24325 [Micromonospora sp. NPDC005222]|uniref:hypothetical protein n=1 Tax=unclassified Micromonospora TaxID=2617518 RepID=UPI0033AFF249
MTSLFRRSLRLAPAAAATALVGAATSARSDSQLRLLHTGLVEIGKQYVNVDLKCAPTT